MDVILYYQTAKPVETAGLPVVELSEQGRVLQFDSKLLSQCHNARLIVAASMKDLDVEDLKRRLRSVGFQTFEIVRNR